MIKEVRQEINMWTFRNTMPEQAEYNLLDGMIYLERLNSSHPIKKGLSMLYLVRKPNMMHRYSGSRKFRWSQCCILFKDLYLDKDWIIQINASCAQMVPREQYFNNMPTIIHIHKVPLRSLKLTRPYFS